MKTCPEVVGERKVTGRLAALAWRSKVCHLAARHDFPAEFGDCGCFQCRCGVFAFEVAPRSFYFSGVTVESFRHEIDDALKAYEKYIVCVDKVPQDCERSLESLMEKAIKAYENRGPHLRHGIALDKHVTIILSQTENERPLCGIYFNLHSPYQKKPAARAAKTEK